MGVGCCVLGVACCCLLRKCSEGCASDGNFRAPRRHKRGAAADARRRARDNDLNPDRVTAEVRRRCTAAWQKEDFTELIGGLEEWAAPIHTALAGTGKEVEARFLCPLTKELMRDPVSASDGHAYERGAIEAWLAKGNTKSPMTNETTHTGDAK